MAIPLLPAHPSIAFMAVIMGLGLLCYLLLGFRVILGTTRAVGGDENWAKDCKPWAVLSLMDIEWLLHGRHFQCHLHIGPGALVAQGAPSTLTLSPEPQKLNRVACLSGAQPVWLLPVSMSGFCCSYLLSASNLPPPPGSCTPPPR